MANFTLLLPLADRKGEKTSRRAEVNKNSLFAVFQIPTEDLTHFMHTHAACMCTQPAADLQKNNKKHAYRISVQAEFSRKLPYKFTKITNII